MTKRQIDDGLRPLFRRHLPMVDWQTMENAVNRGVPDSNGCFRGTEFWVEYKATKGWAVTLRPEQIGWIARRVRNGGRVHVAVRRRNGGGPRIGPPIDELWLVPGALVRQARISGLRGLHNAALHWGGGPVAWDWPHVLRALVAGTHGAALGRGQLPGPNRT